MVAAWSMIERPIRLLPERLWGDAFSGLLMDCLGKGAKAPGEP